MTNMRMWRITFGILSTRTVVANNAKEAMEKAIKRDIFPGANLHNVTKVELIGEETYD